MHGECILHNARMVDSGSEDTNNETRRRRRLLHGESAWGSYERGYGTGYSRTGAQRPSSSSHHRARSYTIDMNNCDEAGYRQNNILLATLEGELHLVLADRAL